MKPWIWKAAAPVALAAAIVMAPRTAGQEAPGFPSAPLPQKNGPLQKALLLLRAGKTVEARKELEAQRAQRPGDAEVLYQIARSYLMDFYSGQDPGRRKMALALAMENLDS